MHGNRELFLLNVELVDQLFLVSVANRQIPGSNAAGTFLLNSNKNLKFISSPRNYSFYNV